MGETTEQRPPESNQEQFMRWVAYVDSDLWPKIQEFEKKCATLYDSTIQKGLQQAIDQTPELKVEWRGLRQYADRLSRELRDYAGTFQNKRMVKFVGALGHSIIPYTFPFQYLFDKIEDGQDIRVEAAYSNRPKELTDYTATKEMLLEKAREVLEITKV